MGGSGVIVNLGGGRGFLREAPAKSLARIDRVLGHRMQTTETLRSWAQQNAHWQHYLKHGAPIALHPDTPSIHQLGAAIDSDEAQNHIALMEEHGWRRTVYRWVGGVWTLVERWHFEYKESLDKHRREVVRLVRSSSGAWHLPDPLSGGNTAPEIPPVEAPEEDTMKIFGYPNPEDRNRTYYVEMDTSSGFWHEWASTDEKYIQSYAAKWTPDGIPLLSLGHRNGLKAECDRVAGRAPAPRAVTGAVS